MKVNEKVYRFYTCEFCGKELENKELMEEHEASHVKPLHELGNGCKLVYENHPVPYFFKLSMNNGKTYVYVWDHEEKDCTKGIKLAVKLDNVVPPAKD